LSLALAIRPHPAAPLFAAESNPELVLRQLLEEVARGNWPVNAAFMSIIRQACFVSLFFLLRNVASVTGPYEKLNETLHLDMCNYMQSDAVMRDGARSAMILTRGFYKSTIGNHGHNTWLALRDPNVRIRNVSNIVERAHEFKSISQRFFDSNPLARELFGARTFDPELDLDPTFAFKGYIPSKTARRWNENEFVLPNRTREYTEPTIGAGGATGASEGVHVDVLKLDDLEGLDDLTSDHRANANMGAKKKWFKTNATTLLVDRRSRIHVNGTFYASDDIHMDICADAYEFRGYADPEFTSKPDGTWSVYYRSWEENGKAVFPDVMDRRRYAKLLDDDPWTAITQYSNKPRDPALSEFFTLPTKRATLLYSSERGEFFIRQGAVGEEENWEDGPSDMLIRLSACDVVMAVDPAGTERGITAKTSRTAIGIVAMDWEENAYLIWSKTGYYPPVRVGERGPKGMFDYIFEGCAKFRGVVREVGVEAAAMQKIIKPLLERERALRGFYINPQPVQAGGDKEARIRMNVGRALTRGKVWLCYGEETYFEEERMTFPSGRIDTLDMFEKALVRLRKPQKPGWEDETEPEDLEVETAVGRSAVTGY